MNNLFSIDSKFFKFMNGVADCFILSLLWVVFSLPVITIGASTSALYYCVIKVIRRQEGSVLGNFWQAFRSNLKQGIIAALLVAAGAFCVTLIGTAVYRSDPTQETLQSVYLAYLCTLAVAAAWLHYLFSHIARFENSMAAAVKNTIIICLSNLPQSFLIAVTFAAVMAVFVLYLPISILGLFFAPAVYVLVVSFLVERIYEKYLPQEEAKASETEE